MKVLLFAGTTEARKLATILVQLGVTTEVSVATEYGRELLRELAGSICIRSGRMHSADMVTLLHQERYSLVIDATHPYASEAAKNIRNACVATGSQLLRLSRPASKEQHYTQVTSAATAAAWAATLPGNILLTTGSKTLHAYTAIPQYAQRVFPRVLPTVEALLACRELGYRSDHIIAMQGPFGKAMNLAIMHQFAIKLMITKDGGTAGGFSEKLAAAQAADVQVAVIDRPQQAQGMSMDTLLAEVRKRLEVEK